MKLLLGLSMVLLVEWIVYPPPILTESPNGYIGCFLDSSTRVLNGAFYSGPITMQYCRTSCQKYTYFGLQNGNECYCGNSYESNGKVKESDCSVQCEGDSSQICGGEWRNSLYRTVPSSEIVPISRGKKASQSSQFNQKIADFAVDGNYNQTYGSDTGDQPSCATTKAETNPWWKLDLGVSHYVASVKIWNRGDCCGERLNELKVQLSNEDVFWTDFATLNENAVSGGVYSIQVNAVGRYVRLMSPRNEILTLCEVDVFGKQADCQPGELSLLSRGKKVSQSSVWYEKKVPQFAVDGNYIQVLSPDDGDQVSCAGTNPELNPWWKVDLGESHPIYGVRVWNRADCCGERLTGLQVQFSDDDVNWKEAGALNENTVHGGIYAIKTIGSGRYVRLTVARIEFLTLCEVEVYASNTKCSLEDPNLVSRGKNVSQSSQFHKKIPQFAVDGNYLQSFGSDTGDQMSCTSTNSEANPWWQVDLERTHEIFSVKLWNRADCCGGRLAGLKVQLSDEGIFWTDVASMNEKAFNGGIYRIEVKGSGRYVRLMLPRSDFLTLCEVEVYGRPLECQPGKLSLLSRGKKASQTNVWYGKKVPQFAVDGNYIQVLSPDGGDQVSCAATNTDPTPWWKVDLGESHPIYGVRVWNRADCCGERLNGLQVQFSEDDLNWKEAGALNENAVSGGIYAIKTIGSARYVRLTVGRSEYFVLCEVEVYSRTECPAVNADLVSRGKTVSQSSQFHKKIPQFAVDGIYTQTSGRDDGNQLSCASTTAQTNPWWKVDLGKSHQVFAVKVWNRADCCGERLKDLKVQLSDDDTLWTDVASLNESAFNSGIYRIEVKGSGRYVRLMIPRLEYLTLCEVEVYGKA